jgi:hypothetical protein
MVTLAMAVGSSVEADWQGEACSIRKQSLFAQTKPPVSTTISGM